MITVNTVRDAVVSTLNAHFPNIDIHGEEIRQGFQEPCFFVKLFPVYHTKELNRRYRRQHSFDIHYFGDSNEDMHNMADQLCQHLELVEIDGVKRHGTKMYHEIIDGVLHFYVDYEFNVYKKAEPGIPMGPLEVEGHLKNG